nr:EOG090X0KOU [Leptodora kindtii]
MPTYITCDNATTVFVTVGTTSFDKLIQTVLQSEILVLLEKVGCRKLVLQIGRGQEPIIPHNCPIEITWFRLKNGIREDIDNASLVISHAGAGSCTEVLAAKKPLIVVVNQDLMDNHQSELAEQLHCDGHVLVDLRSTCDNRLRIDSARWNHYVQNVGGLAFLVNCLIVCLF